MTTRHRFLRFHRIGRDRGVRRRLACAAGFVALTGLLVLAGCPKPPPPPPTLAERYETACLQVVRARLPEGQARAVCSRLASNHAAELDDSELRFLIHVYENDPDPRRFTDTQAMLVNYDSTLALRFAEEAAHE